MVGGGIVSERTHLYQIITDLMNKQLQNSLTCFKIDQVSALPHMCTNREGKSDEGV